MFVVCVTVLVKPGAEPRFVAATLDNARATRGESGNVRFDLLRSDDDPGRFFLYEVYKEKEDFVRHQTTAHYLLWKATVADMMREPRIGVKHHSLFFGDAEG